MDFFPTSFTTIQPGPGTVVLGSYGSNPYNVDMSYIALNSTASIAALGNTQSTATPLTSSYNVVTASASGSGVVLPIPTVSTTVAILNRSAYSINVYPGLGASIETQGANNPILLNTGDSNIIVYTGDYKWYVL